MYSPQKSNLNKEEAIRMAKDQKRAQLHMLLVNKFRNKFNINGSTEMDIDKIIREEIKDLLADGKTYESNLNKLDKKLEGIIA
jgi:hypothetical protein